MRVHHVEPYAKLARFRSARLNHLPGHQNKNRTALATSQSDTAPFLNDSQLETVAKIKKASDPAPRGYNT